MAHLNFIPSELRPKFTIPNVLIPLGLVGILCLYIGGTVVWTQIESYRQGIEFAKVEAENAELAKKIEALSGSKDGVKAEEALNAMKKVLAKKTYWSGIFREMSVLMPEGVWLTSFVDAKDQKDKGASRKVATAVVAGAPADPDLLLIKGESDSQETIALFLITLEKSHHFAGVQLKSTEKEVNVRPLRYKFEFSIPVKPATNGSS